MTDEKKLQVSPPPEYAVVRRERFESSGIVLAGVDALTAAQKGKKDALLTETEVNWDSLFIIASGPGYARQGAFVEVDYQEGDRIWINPKADMAQFPQMPDDQFLVMLTAIIAYHRPPPESLQ